MGIPPVSHRFDLTNYRLKWDAPLTWNDVDINRKLIYIRTSKSGKSRIIPMNESVKAVLFSLGKLPGSSHIFSGYRRNGFERAMKDAEIKDASFHTLRHTFASQVAMAGVDILTISRLLGHSDIKMSMRYAHLGPEYMAHAVKALDTF